MYEDVRLIRAERFGRATYCLPGLISSRPVNIAPIQIAVLRYISALQEHYGVEFSSLPNISQTRELRNWGACLDERNYVDRLVFDLLKPFNISKWAKPAIRLLAGEKSFADEHRYATSKLHTDIWGGEHRGTMNILLPVFDSGVDCEFYEPKEMIPLNPQGDYDHANKIEVTKVEHKTKVGELTFFDAMLLHKTIRNGSGYRISIDGRGLYREQLHDDNSDWPSASKYEVENV
jgi:hypothetical protein